MTALAFALRNWKLIAGGLALAVLGVLLVLAKADARHWHKRFDQEYAAHALDVANFRAASAKAAADNIAAVRATESKTAAIVEDSQNDLETQLAAARAAGAAYSLRRCPTGADPGSGGSPRVSETPGTPSDPVGAGSLSVMDADDVQACSAAVVKARGWQSFYGGLRETVNATGAP